MTPTGTQHTATGLQETGITGLLATSAAPLPFGTDAVMRSFLLQGEGGNVLVYGSDTTAAASAIAAAGGVERQLLGHWHEAGLTEGRPDAPLLVHADDAGETSRRLERPETFAERRRLGAGVEAIPIPGHTPGSAAYLWEGDDGRVLFTADSIYVSRGRWVAALLDSSDREAYLASLESLRAIEFDVLAPWVGTAGDAAVERVEPAVARDRLGAIIARLEAGENH